MAAAAIAAGGPESAAAVVPVGFADQLVSGGLESPVGLAFLPDGRVLVIEQLSGRIRMIRDGVVTTPGTVPDIRLGGERGLLGIAVDPEWPARPFVYVHSTTTVGTEIRVSRFAASGDLEDGAGGDLTIRASSRYEVLTGLPDALAIHNGGTLRFGPDSMLYVSLGDDAEGCDAQRLDLLKGKILRLDVRGLPADSGGPPPRTAIAPADNPFADSPDEAERLVWAYGLRNPFRFSIDPDSGRLYVADVGQNDWEEMDEVAAGGGNFGWPWFEGFATGATCQGSPGVTIDPIHVYDHLRAGQEAIIAGPLYRGVGPGPERFPAEYEGDLFLSDYYHGDLVRLTRSGGSWAVAPEVPGQVAGGPWGTGYTYVPDYAVGPEGGIWYCKQSAGEVRRIVGAPPSGAVEPPPRPPARAGWYDIQGRRVEHPSVHGIYFSAGRRSVVRP